MIRRPALSSSSFFARIFQTTAIVGILATALVGCGDNKKAKVTLADGGASDGGGFLDAAGTGPGGEKLDTAPGTSDGDGGVIPGTDTLLPMGDAAPGASDTAPVVLNAVEVTPSLTTLAMGTSVLYSAIARYSDGSTKDVSNTAVWSSSMTAVATIAGQTATAVAAGQTSIVATFIGTTGTATLKVSAATLASIIIEPADGVIPVSSKLSFKATGVFSDGTKQDLTTVAAWAAEDAATISVSSTGIDAGVAKGLKVGSSKLTATFMGTTGETSVSVSAATLESIEVAPAQTTLAVGVGEKFVATGVYSDGTKLDVTEQAIWSSGDATVVTVSNTAGTKGVSAGIKAGNAKIKAALNGKEVEANVTVTPATLSKITVSPADATAPVGVTAAFTAEGLYSDNSKVDVTDTVTWSTSAPAVANASNASGSRGVATGLTAGSANIVATLGMVSGSAKLTVTAAVLKTLTVTPATGTLPAGRKLQLSATAEYTDGKKVDVTSVATWTSAAPSIAAVATSGAASGLVTGLSAGNSRVSASLDAKSAGADITITNAVLESITVTPATATIVVGTTQAFTARAYYSDATDLDVTKQVVWSSSSTMTASVANASGAQGIATGVNAGTANIIATIGAIKGSGSLTVAAPVLVGISVSPVTASRHLGETQGFAVVGVYSNGTSRNLGGGMNNGATWRSSATNIATIGNNGNARCVAEGTATITAIYMNFTDVANLSCTAAIVARIQVTPLLPTVFVNAQQQFTAVAIYTDDTTRDVTNQTAWTSSNAAVATIANNGNQRGNARGQSAGSSTINAVYMGFQDTATITVTEAKIISIAITPALLNMRPMQTQQLQVTGSFSDGSVANITTQATFNSTNSNVADVSNAGGGGGPFGGGAGTKGLLTALAAGSTVVKATVMGLSDSVTVNVSAAKLVGIEVTPALASVVLGQQLQFQATALYDDNSVAQVSGQSVWLSSNVNIADVSNANNRGATTGLKVGTVTISASFMGFASSASLTVTDATLTEIQVTPVNPIVPVGLPRAFVAIGLYSDLSVRTLTNVVSWSSSDEAVARVSNAGGGNKGVATTLAAGPATITASYQGKTGSSKITVVASNTLTSIIVTPATASTAPSTTVAFTAVANFGGLMVDITDYATWISSNKPAAVVSNADGSRGLTTALSVGTASIEANFNGQKGAATLTVAVP